MVIEPRIRGFVCTTAHPDGCREHVREQIDAVLKRGSIDGSPQRALVIGSSTGYGLASRIALAFGGGAGTVGVFFERPPAGERTASAGWYNSAAFHEEAQEQGLYAGHLNGDAFSDELKAQTIAEIKANLGTVDVVVYSLASPRRTHPGSGETFRSVLKPIGQAYRNKTLNTDRETVEEVTLEAASDDEIAATVQVMGGEDWEMWMRALEEGGVLAPGVRTLAYSYIGPELTWPIYRNGTIGKAKEDLERAARAITEKLSSLQGRAQVAVNKAVVTQASSAIPVVPLYISLLYRIMKERGLHEEPIHQMDRLFREKLTAGETYEAGRIRLDDWEMREEIQAEVERLWPLVTTENLHEHTDFAGYRESFLRLFGFGLPGVDYSKSVPLERLLPLREA